MSRADRCLRSDVNAPIANYFIIILLFYFYLRTSSYFRQFDLTKVVKWQGKAVGLQIDFKEHVPNSVFFATAGANAQLLTQRATAAIQLMLKTKQKKKEVRQLRHHFWAILGHFGPMSHPDELSATPHAPCYTPYGPVGARAYRMLIDACNPMPNPRLFDSRHVFRPRRSQRNRRTTTTRGEAVTATHLTWVDRCIPGSQATVAPRAPTPATSSPPGALCPACFGGFTVGAPV